MAQAKTDLEKLQGTWTIVTLEMNGAQVPVGSPGDSKIVIQGDRFTTISMGASYDGIITLDATKKPKTFDLKFTAGPEKGNSSLGIYELQGDQWKICLTVTGASRPIKFETKAGSGHALEMLRRDGGAGGRRSKAQAGGKDASSEPRFEPVAELQGEWDLVSLAMDGKPLDAAYVQYGKRVVVGDEMKLTFGKDLVVKAKMSADPHRYPKTMDYAHTAGMLSGKGQQGIYELNGETLKICSSPPGELRPTDFTATPENRRTLAVWSRVKR